MQVVDGACLKRQDEQMRRFENRKHNRHPLQWVVEPLKGEPTYLERPMFGCRACYFRGRLALVLASRRQEPWKGVLIPTDREHHDSLIRDFPQLRVHSVLGKWLYLSEDSEEFEELVPRLVDRVARGDPRIGVYPQPKKREKWKPRQVPESIDPHGSEPA